MHIIKHFLTITSHRIKVMNMCFKCGLYWRGLTHDLSKYSKTECVHNIDDIEHPIFRECLKQEGLEGYEITSIADVPQGTGLGSSSAFTVGLIKNLKCQKREYASYFRCNGS